MTRLVIRILLAAVTLGLVAACRPGTRPTPVSSSPTKQEHTPDGGGADASTVEEWTAYGHDASGSRWSPLRDVTRANVRRLAVAWTVSTGERDLAVARSERFALETTPVVVDGTLYASTPLGRVLALDPATGARRWAFDPHVDQRHRFGDFTNRGVATWLDSAATADAPCRRTIFVAVIDARLIALDAATGAPCARFGERGTVNLRLGLRNAPFETEEYEETSPPTVVNGLVIVGSAVADNNRADAASGEVRAYDARTGALRWSWDPVPQRESDPAWKTWEGLAAHRTGAANAWSVLAADPVRGLVFVPTASPSPDYYGGERLGDDRYANSIVALHAATGEVAWSFQTVHHDLWDYDNASPPALVTVRRGGRSIDAVLQATKTGQLFVLDRDTGEPVFPVEERPVPASDVPGERASATQPFSAIPALSPQRLSAEEAWGPTAADRAACRAEIGELRNEGPFTPPSLRGTLVMPSNIGGAHWGGVAYDPDRQIVVIPVNRVAAEVQILRRADFLRMRGRPQRGERLNGGWEYGEMRGTPYGMRRRIMRAPGGAPCTPPPFGSLVAISLATGRMLWDVPLGDVRDLLQQSDSAAAAMPPGIGSPNLGGPIATAGGIVFVGAALDHALHAFDIETGRELWRGRLPRSARATPMTYRATTGGRQFIVIASGGGGAWGRGDELVAFALP